MLTGTKAPIEAKKAFIPEDFPDRSIFFFFFAINGKGD
jgi:hypothetical protein